MNMFSDFLKEHRAEKADRAFRYRKEVLEQLEKGEGLFDNHYRLGSESFFEFIEEARSMYYDNLIEVDDDDAEILESDLGQWAELDGEMVPLDCPMMEAPGDVPGRGEDYDFTGKERGMLKGIMQSSMRDAGQYLRDIQDDQTTIGRSSDALTFYTLGAVAEDLYKHLRAGVNVPQFVNLMQQITARRLMDFQRRTGVAGRALDVSVEDITAQLETDIRTYAKQFSAQYPQVADSLVKKLGMSNAEDNTERVGDNEYGDTERIRREGKQGSVKRDAAGRSIQKMGRDSDPATHRKRKMKNPTMTTKARSMSLDEGKKSKKKKKKDKNPPLNKPKRGGSKKFYVYVKTKSGNIKKVSWGDTSGLSVKMNDPKARKSFAARHKCAQQKDKTKASYWACNTPRYAKQLGLSGGGSFFW